MIVRSTVTAPDSLLFTIRCAARTLVSTMTIQRQLRERNLLSYWPLHHLPVTSAHCRTRLQWCLARWSWDNADWRRIVFNDESRLQLCPDDHRRHVWKRTSMVQSNVLILLLLLNATQAHNKELWSGMPFPLIAGSLWSSLKTHLKHGGTSKTFWELFY